VARTGRTDQGGDTAGRDGDVDPVEDGFVVVAGGQAGEPQGRCAPVGRRLPGRAGVFPREGQYGLDPSACGHARLDPAHARGQHGQRRDDLEQVHHERGEVRRAQGAGGETDTAAGEDADDGDLLADAHQRRDERLRTVRRDGRPRRRLGTVEDAAGGVFLRPRGLDDGDGRQGRGEPLGDLSQGLLLGGDPPAHSFDEHREGTARHQERSGDDQQQDPVQESHADQGDDGHQRGGRHRGDADVEHRAQLGAVGGHPGGEVAGAGAAYVGQPQPQGVPHQATAGLQDGPLADPPEQERGPRTGQRPADGEDEQEHRRRHR
jgi:hypothetical protein